MKVIIDTNVLLDYPEVLKEYSSVYLPSTVLEELDKLKRDRERGYKARTAIRAIQSANINFIIKDIYDMPEGWEDKNDNRIIMCAKENELTLISNDIVIQTKCKAIGVVCLNYVRCNYKGYIYIEGDSDKINSTFSSDTFLNRILENQYLIINENGKYTEMVKRNGALRTLNLPKSEVVKGLNSEQRCALDLLNNKDIPIKIITGVAGSGKTFLTARMGVNAVMGEGDKEKLILVRNPIGSGENIGFLPGTFEEKTESFFAPVVDCLGGNVEMVRYMKERGILEHRIPYFMKGLTIDNAFILVDEAEDLNLKILKLIGTRVGKNSCIVFCGDYRQAEGKFTQDNGIQTFIEACKGNPLVGVMTLDMDVRSSASRIFSNLD